MNQAYTGYKHISYISINLPYKCLVSPGCFTNPRFRHLTDLRGALQRNPCCWGNLTPEMGPDLRDWDLWRWSIPRWSCLLHTHTCAFTFAHDYLIKTYIEIYWIPSFYMHTHDVKSFKAVQTWANNRKLSHRKLFITVLGEGVRFWIAAPEQAAQDHFGPTSPETPYVLRSSCFPSIRSPWATQTTQQIA